MEQPHRSDQKSIEHLYWKARELLALPTTGSGSIAAVGPSIWGFSNTRETFRNRDFPLTLLAGDTGLLNQAYNALDSPERYMLEGLLEAFVSVVTKGREGNILFSPAKVDQVYRGTQLVCRVTFGDNLGGDTTLLAPPLDLLIERTKLYDRNIFSQHFEGSLEDLSEAQAESDTRHEGFQEVAAAKKTIQLTPVTTIRKNSIRVPVEGLDPHHVVYLMECRDEGELNIALYEPPLIVVEKEYAVYLDVGLFTGQAGLHDAFASFVSSLKDAMFDMRYCGEQPRFVRDHISPVIFSIEKLLRKGYNRTRAKEHEKRFRAGVGRLSPPSIPCRGTTASDQVLQSLEPDADAERPPSRLFDVAKGIVGKKY